MKSTSDEREAFRARPRRSVLFLPSSNARAIDKARTLASDVVVLDLEDSVGPEAKDLARAQMLQALRDGGFSGRELLVRINGQDTPWARDDFEAALEGGADGVVIPKVGHPVTVEYWNDPLGEAPKAFRLWAMIESAFGVLNVGAIAAVSRETRLAGLIFGSNDLSAEMRARRVPGRAPLQAFLSTTVAAARAYGLVVIDGVYNDYTDEEGLVAECRQGLEFGFDGKSMIHPNQVDAVNRLFSPTDAELAWARAVVDGFSAPDAGDKGVISVNGKMVERMHLAEARRMLATPR